MNGEARTFTPRPHERSLEQEEREMIDRLRRLEQTCPEFTAFVRAALGDVRDRIARITKELERRTP